MTPERWLKTVDPISFRRRLLAWYARRGRHFPWRNTTDPYAVWVSEVMLQQTTTAVVAKRFIRFLKRFPTVVALAAADEQSVLHEWEGLGYYRRARNLHRAAKVVCAEFGGRVPTDPAILQSLPGIGRYSANAIVCFAIGEPWPVLEANTVRLWSRLCGARGDPTKQPLRAGLWKLAEGVLSSGRPREFNLALMDLGSLVCKPREPDCPTCPLKRDCVARQSGNPERYPRKPRKANAIDEAHVAVAFRRRGRILLVRRGEAGRWAAMWGLPTARLEPDEKPESATMRIAERFGLAVNHIERLPDVRHGVMHYRIRLAAMTVDVGSVSATGIDDESRWIPVADLASLPFSSAHRRIVTSLAEKPVGEALT
jgi:A/G-specific adenine glycosylase